MSNATILIVDDDDLAAELTIEMLMPEYCVHHVDNGKAALETIAKQMPDLILLDVTMPGMSGYEVCQALRNDPSIDSVPVIFLSGMVNEEDRLAGYEAGGDDYLTKPVAAKELRSKVKKALGHYAERLRLRADASSAFSTAMTAMSSLAEIGEVLNFLRTSFNSPDYLTLARNTLSTLSTYGLDASVQIRGQQGAVCLTPEGYCSPLEESVMSNMAHQDRLFEFGTRLSCNYDHVTVIIKNAPRNDADRYGRIKDNLALLAEGIDASVVRLDASVALSKQHAGLTKLIANTRVTLQGIDQHHQNQRAESSQILQDFRSQLDSMLLTIGLTQSQEEELVEKVQKMIARALALHDESEVIGANMESLLRQLDDAGNNQGVLPP